MNTTSTITTSQMSEPAAVLPQSEVKKLHVHRSTWAVVAISGWMFAALATIAYYDMVKKLAVANAELTKPVAIGHFVTDYDLETMCPSFMLYRKK